jgi:hypothetical protein
MTRNLDLVTASNWSLSYSNSVTATVIGQVNGNNVYAKITPIKPSIIFDSSIIAIGINTSVPAGKQWVYGGSIFRFTNSSFGKTFIGERRPLFLGFNLAIFDDFSNDYQMQINIPSWFTSANIAVYQYEGNTQTVCEQDLAAIKAVVAPNS